MNAADRRLLTAALGLALGLGLSAPGEAPAQPQPTQARGGNTGRIKVDFIEVRAGPGAAYLAQGRAYQGDTVKVLQRDPGGDWLEIEANGLRGWIKASAVNLQAGGEAPSPGRDRRQTNFTYDAQGRRVFADGTAMGSGEGIGDREDTPVGDPTRSAPGRVRVRVGFGGARIARDWTAAVEPDSALAQLGVNSMAISTELETTFDPVPWLRLRLLFRDARLSEAVVPPNAGFGFPDGLGIDVNSQQAELDAAGRLTVALGNAGTLNLGVYAGGHLFRHAFQETRPFALFLTNTFVGLGTGVTGDWRLGAFEATVRAGIIKPLSVSQTPAESGQPSSFGGQGSLDLAWWFTDRWALAGQLHFMVLNTDWSGESTHHDPFTGPPVLRTYIGAREEDQVLGGGLGVRFRP